jgi:hypothetical protein
MTDDPILASADRIARRNPEPGAVTVRLADVVPERVSWLWPARLPIGKLVVLDGDPAVGKSTLAVDWAARVTTGHAWPDGAACPRGAVLLLSAEDGLADTIRPRLDAADGDATKMHALTEIRYVDDQGASKTRPTTLADLEHIERAVMSTGAVLVVVDVLMAFLPGRVDAHRDQDVRGVLAGLAAMAERTSCVVLLLRHLNKAAGGSALYRGGGSIGIIGAARVGMLAAIDPDDETRRVLAGLKCNLAALPDALTYQLVDSPDHGCARVQWLGTSSHSAGALLALRGDEDERTERDEAADWLTSYLTDNGGEMPAKDVLKAARGDGMAERTLRRARDRAGITSERRGFGQGAVWSLNPLRPRSGHSGQPPGPGRNGTNDGRNAAEVIELHPSREQRPGCPSHPDTPLTTDGRCPLCVLDKLHGGAS